MLTILLIGKCIQYYIDTTIIYLTPFPSLNMNTHLSVTKHTLIASLVQIFFYNSGFSYNTLKFNKIVLVDRETLLKFKKTNLTKFISYSHYLWIKLKMGCKLSQLASSEFSHDPFEKPPPPSDPRSPLTAKQQYCMLASWKGVFRQVEKTGILLFVK